MPVFARRVKTTDERFSGRVSRVISVNAFHEVMQKSILVPDNVVLCNGCNRNLHPNPGFGYLVYLGKRELKADTPYDIYCEECLKKYFKGYVEAELKS